MAKFQPVFKGNYLSVNNVIPVRVGLGAMAPKASTGGMERELLRILASLLITRL